MAPYFGAGRHFWYGREEQRGIGQKLLLNLPRFLCFSGKPATQFPFALEKAIVKCLELQPDKRYPIMSVLVHDLKTALYV